MLRPLPKALSLLVSSRKRRLSGAKGLYKVCMQHERGLSGEQPGQQ